MRVYFVWVLGKVYRLYVEGNNIRYEGNGKFVVQQGTKELLKRNQQEC